MTNYQNIQEDGRDKKTDCLHSQPDSLDCETNFAYSKINSLDNQASSVDNKSISSLPRKNLLCVRICFLHVIT